MRDEEISRFRTQLKALQRRLRQESPPAPGVSSTGMRLLGAAARAAVAGRPAQPGQLADELQMTSSNVAAALREVQAAGLVRRRRDAADARRVLVELTDAGAAVVAEHRRERDTWLGQAIGALLDDGERATLLAAGDLLERLAGWQAPAGSGAP
jgi:DNA-binding MarR family transcriptional regulator